MRVNPSACRALVWLPIALWLLTLNLPAASRTRQELWFPDLDGFVTLRCDFHLHTVFSDGNVWPTVRVEEAWRNGLDAIAISDHIEYLPHRADVSTNLGRAFQIASPSARGLGLLLVPAAEITKGEPPGHWNALFVTNVQAVAHPAPILSVSNAVAQGAFVFWNHPGWKQPDKKPVWYEAQETVHAAGWLHGIEIVNGDDYYTLAHAWAVGKNLTPIGNTDAHDPLHFDYHRERGEIAPLTLVFARERSVEGLREALFARRTAVVAEGKLYGNEELLKPLFHRSLEILNPPLKITGKGTGLLQVRNRAAIDFEVQLNPKLPELDVPERPVRLHAGRVSIIPLRCVSERVSGRQTIALACRVLNAVPEPDKFLRTSLVVDVEFK